MSDQVRELLIVAVSIVAIILVITVGVVFNHYLDVVNIPYEVLNDVSPR